MAFKISPFSSEKFQKYEISFQFRKEITCLKMITGNEQFQLSTHSSPKAFKMNIKNTCIPTNIKTSTSSKHTNTHQSYETKNQKWRQHVVEFSKITRSLQAHLLISLILYPPHQASFNDSFTVLPTKNAFQLQESIGKSLLSCQLGKCHRPLNSKMSCFCNKRSFSLGTTSRDSTLGPPWPPLYSSLIKLGIVLASELLRTPGGRSQR